MKTWGIDISSWQKGINLEQAKKEGIEFAILRAGTSYGKDKCFESFYKECKKLDIPVGAYFYIYSTNVDDAKKDAQKLLTYLKGKFFEYPIALDIESSYHKELDKETNDAIITAFCEVIENAGYWASVYTNVNFYKNYCNGKILNKKYDWWMARWSSVAYTGYNSGLTQFGGESNYIRSNKVAGYVCDQNYSYYDYPALMIKYGLNGYGKKQETINKENKKSIDDIANEVIDGKWGNGQERKEKLTKQGYDYNIVQKRVNEIIHKSNKIYHVVKKGDCLWDIAVKYYGSGSKYKDIKKLNDLSSNMIYPGQKLLIK